MLYDRSELSDQGFGFYGVRILNRRLVTLKDGVKLSIKIWMPVHEAESPKEEDRDEVYCPPLFGPEERQPEWGKEKKPCVLEFLPYRKDDYTAPRDHVRHPWLCSHGFVVVRGDMRGTGDSGGLYFDEYDQQEQDDCCELIDWISQQPWSNERVGMFGKSWGGFNGLQVAFCQPKALKAAISLYSTDNRFSDDIHWKGNGLLLGNGMLSWASTMFAWNARPPSPVGWVDKATTWRTEWKRRLEKASQSWAEKWLEHQDYDSYWKHGSIAEAYSKVSIPILAIGGWHDGYTNPVFRLVEKLPNCRAIIGPWSHNWPDVAVPGPQIGFMQECLSFWKHHLMQEQTNEKNKPKLTWFQCEGEVPPGPTLKTWPGSWHQTNQLFPVTDHVLHLNKNMLLSTEPGNAFVDIPFDSSAGLTCGEWLSFGAPDLPGDQRSANAVSKTWTMDKSLTADMEVFGFPKLNFDFRNYTCEQSSVIARLCDVFPDGRARLVSYGGVNLCRNDKGKFMEMPEDSTATIQLDSLGYTFQTGHKICLALSTSYWPTIWTPPHTSPVHLFSASLSLPLLSSPEATRASKCPFESSTPKYGPSIKHRVLREPSYSRTLVSGLSDSKRCLRVQSDDGKIHLVGEDTAFGEAETAVYSIEEGNPLSAEVCHKHDYELSFGVKGSSEENIRVQTECHMSADREHFFLRHELKTFLNGDVFYERKDEKKIERKGV